MDRGRKAMPVQNKACNARYVKSCQEMHRKKVSYGCLPRMGMSRLFGIDGGILSYLTRSNFTEVWIYYDRKP